jgi:hypothetical protein
MFRRCDVRVSSFLLVLSTAVAVPSICVAQNSASANVTAEVQQPITVTATDDLDFGVVYPGLSKTIGVGHADAAKFTINGQPSANINLTFSLPTELVSGGNTMPLSAWSALHNTVANVGGGTVFVPSPAATSTTLSAAGERFVFVGATADPAVSQPAGTYNGMMTLTVVYY